MPRPDDATDDFAKELVRLRTTPPAQLLAALARPLYDHGGDSHFGPSARRSALRLAAAEGPETEASASALLKHPVDFVTGLSEML